MLGGRLMTVTRRNPQSRSMVGLWNTSEKMPVIRFVYGFVGWKSLLNVTGMGRAVFGR